MIPKNGILKRSLKGSSKIYQVDIWRHAEWASTLISTAHVRVMNMRFFIQCQVNKIREEGLCHTRPLKTQMEIKIEEERMMWVIKIPGWFFTNCSLFLLFCCSTPIEREIAGSNFYGKSTEYIDFVAPNTVKVKYIYCNL